MDLNDLRDIPSRISTAVGNVYDLAKNEYGLWTQQDMTPGLRPQDDEATALLRNAIKNNTGMGPNAQYAKETMGVDPRTITAAMLQAPGQTRVYAKGEQPWWKKLRGTSYGQTHPGMISNTSDIHVYSMGSEADRTNTLLHEGIHGIQNQYGERPTEDIDESRAYWGTGASGTTAFENPNLGTASRSRQGEVEDYLRRRIGNR